MKTTPTKTSPEVIGSVAVVETSGSGSSVHVRRSARNMKKETAVRFAHDESKSTGSDDHVTNSEFPAKKSKYRVTPYKKKQMACDEDELCSLFETSVKVDKNGKNAKVTISKKEKEPNEGRYAELISTPPKVKPVFGFSPVKRSCRLRKHD
eukprot:scaffold55228_cov62-Attheya_sp.AAC.5